MGTCSLGICTGVQQPYCQRCYRQAVLLQTQPMMQLQTMAAAALQEIQSLANMDIAWSSYIVDKWVISDSIMFAMDMCMHDAAFVQGPARQCCGVLTYNDIFQCITVQEHFPECQQVFLVIRGRLIQVQHLICPEVQLRASCSRPYLAAASRGC